MNLYKIVTIIPILLLFLEIDFGDGYRGYGLGWGLGHGFGHWGLAGLGGWAPYAAAAAAALPVTTAVAAPYVVPYVGKHVVLLLLIKIIGLIKYIKITRLMAFGALIMARGTSLLLGAGIGNLATLYYVLYKIHHHHGHYPGWYKPRRRSRLRAFVARLRWLYFGRRRAPYGWKPSHYYRWPTHVKTHYPSSGGWGNSYSSTPVHSYPVDHGSSSGWISGKPSDSFGSSGWSSPASSSYTVPEYAESSYASPSSASEEYSAPVGEDSGWRSGDPPSDWKARSRRHRAKSEKVSDEPAPAEDDQETDFMTGMASTAKEVFKSWFSDVTSMLIKRDSEPETAAGDRADNSTSTTTKKPDILKVLSKRRIQDVLEPYIRSEAFFEQQFNQIEETDEEVQEDKANLYLHLKEAYMQTLLDELAIDSKDKIPEFVPMPPESAESESATTPEPQTETSTSKSQSFSVSQSTSSESSSRQKRATASKTESTKKVPRAPTENELDFVDNLIGETREFFTLLSAFDQDTCIQKLVCDVHTRAEEPVEDGSYDHNMITMFKLVNALLIGDNKGSSVKYREAAYYGEVNRSEELCQQRYKACESTAKEIIQMGKELDS